MITWQDIQEALDNVSVQRLTDPAIVLVDGERINIDLLELELSDVEGERLVGVDAKEIANDTQDST